MRLTYTQIYWVISNNKRHIKGEVESLLVRMHKNQRVHGLTNLKTEYNDSVLAKTAPPHGPQIGMLETYSIFILEKQAHKVCVGQNELVISAFTTLVLESHTVSYFTKSLVICDEHYYC
jgi:hypothetical protein